MSNVTRLTRPFIRIIMVPEIDGQYDFKEGLKLAKSHIDDKFIDDFLEGNVNIDIIFPIGLEQYTADQPPKILGEFFVGLLGQIIKGFRDTHFKKAKYQLKKQRIFDVGKEHDVDDIFNQTFGSVWNTHGGVEEALSLRIRLGVQLDTGEFDYDKDNHTFLAHCLIKFGKAQDVLYLTDFSIMEELKDSFKP